ncbi:MAG: hemolysin III family protein [Mesorhizobium sp.]|uniref:PAQR family membrane homeostasis protein TrhA n=1 Tax=Mesorhizobium sp. TaxID=1871066 RepID=UPI000FE8918E|nr:hemolysin III family protein [Mesorhizobium sp.]RWH80373.1 MAG: hemolysin III family protein [Mesorhizobium sp.]RWH83849.1 MAG: hemolysin III family protein [Mesorhizobium sp.]RWH91955.1 MAG: hemolysin III family protein [Mesorhizobium sp.]RWI00608.1 MAG: hemolysin III family protein [Mesorhizobium sp.]RWI06484.1 MAG: hemolysin III family protein [Mesorhizobium sp.]
MTHIGPKSHIEISQIEIPFMGRWHYSRAEMIADGIVHAVGIVLAIAAGSTLLALAAFHAGPGEYIAAAFYVVSLLTVLSVSLAYNLWPVSSPAKWILRRFDHAAIYLLIAATYTPFLAQLDSSPLAISMIVLVWVAAAIGIAIKVLLPGRFDRLAIVFYLAIGWSGIVLVEPLVQTLPTTSIALIVAGGIIYSCGVIFFAWKGLRFHNALWHGFVVTGAGLHLAAMVDCLVINRL